MEKKELGQFYTTNYKYILQNLKINDILDILNLRVSDIKIIEPFAGNLDLLKFIESDPNKEEKKEDKKIECYDIDPKHDIIVKRDTLLDPPDYNEKFILTNPPFLARNKNKNKEIYDKYDSDDLYKCFLISIINGNPIGGIIIIPLNFLSSIKKKDIELRRLFLNKFRILTMNIFEEKVFEDTGYAVCSMIFVSIFDASKINPESKFESEIKTYIYPSGRELPIFLNKENNYTIGGEIYRLPKSEYRVERATRISKGTPTNILLKCIDDNMNSKIRLEIVNDDKKYIDNTKNLSARSYATLIIEPEINLEEQKKLVEKFNRFLEKEREKYNSLFLTNYRESNSIARKRISFELAFRIVSYLLGS